MPKYIALINWTDKGVAEAKNSVDRYEQARALAQKLGGDIEHIFMTMGSYDLVAISEFPNDEVAAEFVLRIGAGGHLRTTTLKAFDEADYRKIVGSL